MDEIYFDVKNLRKAAIAVGFGLAFGKMLADCTDAVINGALHCSFRVAAERGSKFAQDVCERAKIKYNTKDDHTDETE